MLDSNVIVFASQHKIDVDALLSRYDQFYVSIISYMEDKAKLWGKKATTLSRQQNIATSTAHDERFGKVRTYHQRVLKQVVR